MTTDTYISLDLELNQPSNKIIEVGVCIGAPHEDEDYWVQRSWYLDPEEPIAEFITGLTGITDDVIHGQAVSWEEMVHELTELIVERKPFINPVTWGVGDAPELKAAIRARGIDFPHFGRRWIDVKTLHVFDRLCSGKNTNGGLRSVMTSYGLTFSGDPHRADVDAYNTLRLFFELMRERQLVQEAQALLKQI